MKVLLVDDEPMQVRGLSRCVHWEQFGFEKPDCVTSAEEALKYMEQRSYDVVITDVNMPDKSGLEMISIGKSRGYGATSFIILSGYDEFAYAQEAIRLGVRFYVLKPVKVEDLEEILSIIWMEHNQDPSVKGNGFSTIEKVHPVIFQVIRYIDEKYRDAISTKMLAERFGINSSYLSFLFKKEMKMNIGAYITKVRMQKALQFLREGNYRISEIAEMVGYQTPAYFSEQFRKEYGCNPKDYKF